MTHNGSLAERLGYSRDQRLLIINADDFGMCQSENSATAELLLDGKISSATIMMPCGWAPQAAEFARDHPDLDVGVHLTFTSEWSNYRWAPVSAADHVPSLVDRAGYLHPDIQAVHDRARPEDVSCEIRAQLGRAKALGFSPSHLDNHMFSLYGIRYGIRDGLSFLPQILEICAEQGLPFRIPRYPHGLHDDMPEAATELAERCATHAGLADEAGVVIPDYLRTCRWGYQPGDTTETTVQEWHDLLSTLRPGVTEVYLHPAHESEEFRQISSKDWRKRVLEYEAFCSPTLHDLLKDQGVIVIGWRDLKELQRKQELLD